MLVFICVHACVPSSTRARLFTLVVASVPPESEEGVFPAFLATAAGVGALSAYSAGALCSSGSQAKQTAAGEQSADAEIKSADGLDLMFLCYTVLAVCSVVKQTEKTHFSTHKRKLAHEHTVQTDRISKI